MEHPDENYAFYSCPWCGGNSLNTCCYRGKKNLGDELALLRALEREDRKYEKENRND